MGLTVHAGCHSMGWPNLQDTPLLANGQLGWGKLTDRQGHHTIHTSLKVRIERELVGIHNVVGAVVFGYARHHAGLLVLGHAPLEEVGLALQTDQLHPVKGVGRIV